MTYFSPVDKAQEKFILKKDSCYQYDFPVIIKQMYQSLGISFTCEQISAEKQRCTVL